MVTPKEDLRAEHDLIERMIKIIDKYIEKMKDSDEVNPDFLSDCIDFIHIYTDKIHHGKEEKILFPRLKKETFIDELDKLLIEELYIEHQYVREVVKRITEANKLYKTGNKEKLSEIIDGFERLIRFYPLHAEKEDMNFFLTILPNLPEQINVKLLKEFKELEKNFNLEKYTGMINKYE